MIEPCIPVCVRSVKRLRDVAGLRSYAYNLGSTHFVQGGCTSDLTSLVGLVENM
jgi:hypothetical protein